MADKSESSSKRTHDDNDDNVVKKCKLQNPDSVVPTEKQDRYANDVEHLQKIFPEELWILILEKLRNSLVLENLSKTSPFFRQILEPRRVEYLFPSVLPILANWWSKNEINEDSDDDYYDSSDYDSSDDENDGDRDKKISLRVGKLKLLPLRLVCRFWEKSVEAFMVEHPSHFKIDHQVPLKKLEFRQQDSDSDDDDESNDSDEEGESNEDRTESEWPELKYLEHFTIKDEEKVDQFMEKFGGCTNRNSLFHRKVVIEDPYYGRYITFEKTKALYDRVTTFLEEFGKHLWFCEIRNREYVFGTDYYLRAREWLSLMPNLRVLRWSFPIKWFHLQDHDEESFDFNTQIPVDLICKMEHTVRENPLVKLEHLQVFKADDLSYPIFAEFLRKNDHVSKLQFHRKFPPPSQYQDHYKYNFENALVPNAKEMSLVLWNNLELKDLESAATQWPVLEKLSVFWGSYDSISDGFKRWERIFNVVDKKCGQTKKLKELTLHLTRPEIPSWNWKEKHTHLEVLESSGSLRLNAPSVRKLRLIMPLEKANLNFLSPAMKESLEELEVSLQPVRGTWRKIAQQGSSSNNENTSAGEHTEIQLDGCLTKMHESNIWKELPKLQKLCLKIFNQERCIRVHKYERENILLGDTDHIN